MPDSRWTMADARKYLADSGRQLAPGSMALPSLPQPLPSCTVDEADLVAAALRDIPVHLTLPYPPTANDRLTPLGTKVILTATYRAYRRQVEAAVLQQRGGQPPLTGLLAVTLVWHPPEKRRRDIDNPIKPVLDGLEHAGVYTNDYQIDELHIYRRGPAVPAHVHVTIQKREQQ